MEPLKVINKRLLEYFGRTEDNPRYRLVWSESQYEHRKGNFRVGDTPYVNGIKEVREVKKYNYIKDRYILEKYCPVPPNDELPIASLRGYSYEAIFVFQDSKFRALEPIWKYIWLICQSADKGPDKVFTHRTEDIEKQNAEEADVKYFEDVLEDGQPYLATMLHNKEAIVSPGLPNITANDIPTHFGGKKDESTNSI